MQSKCSANWTTSPYEDDRIWTYTNDFGDHCSTIKLHPLDLNKTYKDNYIPLGGGIRTHASQIQSLLPYHLATPK